VSYRRLLLSAAVVSACATTTELRPVSAEYSFASYHSKAEMAGNVLRYMRTFEVEDPSVLLSKVNDLKMLYRILAGDERNTAGLKPTNS
jgi:hypothetical protein